MNRSTPGLPVHHQLPEFTQTCVHRVSDAIQTSHPLPPSSSFAFSLSQHQGLFQWISSLHQVAASASVFPMNIQGWFPLGLNGLFSFHQRIDERSLICCPKDIPFSVCKYSIFHRLIILFWPFLFHMISFSLRAAPLSGLNSVFLALSLEDYRPY